MERLLHQYFRVLARYNAWANPRLYDACAALDDDAYREARTPAGKSAHELLNLRLATDRLWLSRLQGYLADDRMVEEELHETLEDLREAQLAEDVELFEYVDSLAEEDLLRPTTFELSSGERRTNAQYELLTHLLTDQTAWRGRMRELLPFALDLSMLTFVAETEVGERPLMP
ncbi:MAG TPA: DinB family protein [Gammaproteobacteria bacterium]|nr:DinB family protein [Gammaproteobacteria bacterium]